MPSRSLRSLLEIYLRLPPLFLMDFILKSEYSFTMDLTKFLVYFVRVLFSFFRKSEAPSHTVGSKQFSVMSVIVGFLYLIGFIAALLSFLLPAQQLISIYIIIASGVVVIFSYYMNVEYVTYCTDLINQDSSLLHELLLRNTNAFKMLFGSYILQLYLGIVFCYATKNLPNYLPKKIAGISFIFPTLISIVPLPVSVLSVMPLVSAILTFLVLLRYFLENSSKCYSILSFTINYVRIIVRRNGLISFVIHCWQHFEVLYVLKLFCIVRVILQAVFLLYEGAFPSGNKESDHFALTPVYISIARELVIQSCDTFLAILGTTCILTELLVTAVSYIQSFLLISAEERHNIAPVISVVFLTLAMQTGLTALEPQVRLIRIYRNVMLILSAVTHNVHENVHTVLSKLSISGSTNWRKHIHAVTTGIILFFYSIYMLCFLWTQHELSAWLLSSSAFSLEVIIKVLLSFLVYSMNMMDTHHIYVFENFDDYMFCITSFGNIVSFLFGIFLFFNACYIVIYDSMGITRILMMLSHFYFNIWLGIESGWQIYKKRVFAAALVKALPEANEEQLQLFNDVCSICHQTLNSACVTSCNHYFHAICLKKWLYEQNTCPFCHRMLHLNVEKPAQGTRILTGHEHQE